MRPRSPPTPSTFSRGNSASAVGSHGSTAGNRFSNTSSRGSRLAGNMSIRSILSPTKRSPTCSKAGPQAKVSMGTLGHITWKSKSRAKNLQRWRLRAEGNLKMSDPELLRGMPVTEMMRSAAKVFASKKGTAEDYELSAPVHELDTFVSHTWSTPRWKKYLVLCFHFNLTVSLLIANAVAAVVCALAALGILPTVTVREAYFDPRTDKPGELYTRGILCLPLGLASFLVSLLFLHELDRVFDFLHWRPWRPRSVFLDKVCVHQTDAEKKSNGIQSLAAILNHSREMLVMYSDPYMRRLWTIYEVASWLLLHRGVAIISRPLAFPILILGGTLLFALVDMMVLGVTLINYHTHVSSNVVLSMIIVVFLPSCTGSAYLAANWAKKRERLLHHVENFSLASARCTNEDDRQVVIQNIIAFMKFTDQADPLDADEEVCAAFEKMVHEKVPEVLWSSFGRVGIPYHWAVVFAMPHMFAAFDRLAGYIQDGRNGRDIALKSFQSALIVLVGAPLMVAIIFFLLTRFPKLRGLGGCLCIGLFLVILTSSFSTVNEVMTDLAMEDDTWLAVFLVACAAIAMITFLTYRPITKLIELGNDVVKAAHTLNMPSSVPSTVNRTIWSLTSQSSVSTARSGQPQEATEVTPEIEQCASAA